jgi:subtilisin-like proprotein convertase family protein
MLRQLLLDFQAKSCFEKLREDLSAAHLADDGHLWLASDELPSLERLTWDGAQFGGHESFDLTTLFDLPAGPEGEIDVEGLSAAGDYLWLVGSHSRKIKKPKFKQPDTGGPDPKNIRRLTWAETQTEPNRYLLGRIPLVDGRLAASAAHPHRPGEWLTAAALKFEDDGNALVEALKDDPHIGPYVAAGLPGKANGLDVEGLEVLGDRLLLGLRGPVLLDWALLIEIEPKAKKNGGLSLKKIGPEEEAHFVTMFQKISALADVVSCSWGVGPADAPLSTAFSNALTNLARTGGRRGKGLVICVAAGNNNCPVKDLQNSRTYRFRDRFGVIRSYNGPIDRWIAAHPDVITVSATDEFGGTSSATPTVAGVCGLVLSQNPSLSGVEVRRILQQTADKNLSLVTDTPVNEPGDFDVDGFSLWFGHGKVNALRAVQAAVPVPDRTVDITEEAELNIPDVGAPVVSQIGIADQGTINELRVAVDITHTYIGDLRVDLVAPDGTAVTLHNHTGGSANDLVKTYSPQELPALRALLGKPIQGTWQLRVVDTFRLDVGRLNSWRIVARLAGPPPAAPLAGRAEQRGRQKREAKEKAGARY